VNDDTAMDGPVLLAIDTATTRIVVALGRPDGTLVGEATWPAGYRHGETLLPAIEQLLADHRVPRGRLAGVLVGTGPGAFTGLRVGLATAKGIAHGLGLPIVGISTAEALLAADATATHADATAHATLLLPAGPSDRIVVRPAEDPSVLPSGSEPGIPSGGRLVAVDLDGRAPADAVARGETARLGLARAILELGAARLRAGDVDDLARLVPVYVTLPRGAGPSSGEVAWSHDPR
jgi:tRNA threonylcarbamoyladenosine biosynthesis protein TsaB